MTLAAVALGANLGAACDNVARAIGCLAALPDTRVCARSALYRSRAEGPRQPDYVNAVALIETALPPSLLLDELQHVERAFGRRRGQRWGPRTLDLDVIVYGDRIIDDERLTVPHPRAHLRAFVLRPLAEIAPELMVPGRGAVSHLLSRLPADDDACRRIADG